MVCRYSDGPEGGWRLPMLGKYILEYSSRCGGSLGVGARERGDRDQGLPQGPTATSCPGRVIEGQGRVERLPAFSGEERPRDRQIARGIAHTRGAKVDNRAQPAL